MTQTRFKTVSLLIAASLAAGSVGNAYADGWRHDDYRPPAYRHHEGRHHHHGADWVAPAAILAITGLAIGAAVSHDEPAPRVVYTSEPAYVPPPVYAAPPPPVGAWYYCASSAQYYPYVRFCPEGWQAVMPTR